MSLHEKDPAGPFSSVVPRPPPNIVKYVGDTNPSVWLEDFHLACRLGGADDDTFIIQYLPLYLAKNIRAWVEHLPVDCDS